jgi:hypothetical protein
VAIQRGVLIIADIGGYTHYMNWNRMHLAHAQLTVAALLESVIDAGKGLKLAKLEGDAAFFWAPGGDAKVLVWDGLSRMRQSFLARRERMKKADLCDCASCAQLDNLSLKFVAHEGEVAEQRVKRNVELAGVDVILVHRMLKNQVPVLEYVLMTDTVAQCLDDSRLRGPRTNVDSLHRPRDVRGGTDNARAQLVRPAGGEAEVRVEHVTVRPGHQGSLCGLPPPEPRHQPGAANQPRLGWQLGYWTFCSARPIRDTASTRMASEVGGGRAARPARRVPRRPQTLQIRTGDAGPDFRTVLRAPTTSQRSA